MTRGLLLVLAALLVDQSVYAQLAERPYESRRDGMHLRILRDYDLPAGSTALEPIVVIGGSATVNGRAEDDVVVIGGSLRVGPTAVIRGDVVSMGGETVVDPAAQISGSVDSTLVLGPDFDVAIGPLLSGWWPAFAFGATFLRLGVTFIVAILLTMVTPDWIHRVSRRASAGPFASAAAGLAGQLLFIPGVLAVTVALVVSIVGIVLLLAFPLVLGAAALLAVAGFTAVAVNVGSTLRGRRDEATRPQIGDLVIGFIMLTGVTFVANAMALTPGALGPAVWAVRSAGWTIEWLAWTVGIGAALVTLLGSRRPLPPPLATPAALRS